MLRRTALMDDAMTNTATRLLRENPKDLDLIGIGGNKALQLASRNGREDVVELLLVAVANQRTNVDLTNADESATGSNYLGHALFF